MLEQDRVHLCLDKKNIEIIDRVKKENYFSSRSKAINFIIEQFDKMTSVDSIDNKDLKKEIKKLKTAINSTNKDTQIIVELLNGIYYKEDYGSIPSVEKIPSDAYKISKERVETKIAKAHYRKCNTID